MSDPGREPDYRMQQELEEQRMYAIFVLLDRVTCGTSDSRDADKLAQELGLYDQRRKYAG